MAEDPCASDPCFVFSEENHAQNCCEQVEKLWRDRTLCDINLIVADEEGKAKVSISAHKVILAANVPYFKAMFTSGLQECTQRDVCLKGVDETGLKALVNFLYSGKLEITETNAQGVLSVAAMFDLPNVVHGCARFMLKHLSPLNCLGVREFARVFNLSDLNIVANKFAMGNFAAVSKADEFLSLSLDEVEKFVKSDKINVNSEEDVYVAVTQWIQHDMESRIEHVQNLYDHVRFPILESNLLKAILMENPLISSCSAVQIMVQEALEYHENPASGILFSNPKKTQPRSSVMGVICLVGGAGDAGESLNSVTFFNPHDNQWRCGPKMIKHRSRLAVALFRGELYAIGGADITDCLASMERYSPTTNSWAEVAPMDVPRRSCAAVVTQFGIYVIGGYNGSVFLHSVELYNSELDEWTYQPPMLEARSDCCAVFFDQRIYAIGGSNSTMQLRSVERFDLINRKWERMPDMYAPRANAAAVVLGQEIFVAGGQAEKEVINTTEVYNPDLNQWEQLVARMEVPRVGLAMVSMGNRIYVLGGSNGSEYLSSVECFDPSKLKWVPVTMLPTARFGAAALALSKRDNIAPE